MYVGAQGGYRRSGPDREKAPRRVLRQGSRQAAEIVEERRGGTIMRRTYRGVVCLAAVGIVVLTVLAAALFLQRSREQARAKERGRFRVAGAEPAAVEPAGEGQAAVEPSGAGQAGGGAVGLSGLAVRSGI